MAHGSTDIHIHDAQVYALYRDHTLWLRIPVPNLDLSVIAYLNPDKAQALARGLILAAEAIAQAGAWELT